MSTDISDAFIKHYGADVHEAYQRKGSKLRNTVRQRNNITGSSTTFQKVGKGSASQKTRHGKVPVMNVDHAPVECSLADWFAGDWVDDLDTLKTNIEERNVQVNAGVYALGRKTDEMIIDDALASATNQVAATIQADRTTGSSTGMNLGKCLDAIEALGNRDVEFDDGQTTGVVGWKQWTQLMEISEFKSSDYVAESELPFKGRGIFAKWWMGAMWMPHSGLPITAGDIRSCFLYHKTAVGHASGKDVTTNIQWHNDYDSNFINNKMSQGTVLIDDNGVQEILCDESP